MEELWPVRDPVTPFYKGLQPAEASSILHKGEGPEDVYLLLWAPDHLPRPEDHPPPTSVRRPWEVQELGQPWAPGINPVF